MSQIQIQGKTSPIPGSGSFDINAYSGTIATASNSVYQLATTTLQYATSSVKTFVSSTLSLNGYTLFSNENEQNLASSKTHTVIFGTNHFKNIDRSKAQTPDRQASVPHFPTYSQIESPGMAKKSLISLQKVFGAFIKTAPQELFAQVTYEEAGLLHFSLQQQQALQDQLAAMIHLSFEKIEEQITKKISALPMAMNVLKQAKTLEEFEKAQTIIKEAKFWLVAFNARFGEELQRSNSQTQSCDNAIALSKRQNIKVEKSLKDRSEQLNGDYDALLNKYVAHREMYFTTMTPLKAALAKDFVEPVVKEPSMKMRIEEQMDKVQSHINLLQLTLLQKEQEAQYNTLHEALKKLQTELGKFKLVMQAAKPQLATDNNVHAIFSTLVETHAQALRLFSVANTLLPRRLKVQETLSKYFTPQDYQVQEFQGDKTQQQQAEKMLAQEVSSLKNQQQSPAVRYKKLVNQQYADQGAKVNDRGGLSLREYMVMTKLERLERKEGVAA